MTHKRLRIAVVVLSATTVAACAHTAPSEPSIQVERVYIDRPVPCPALATLGAEPIYPDTDEALEQAEGIGPLARLYRIGRALREQRLAEYKAARAACQALE